MGPGTCDHCGAEFLGKNIRRRFCSTKCRAAAWQDARKHRETSMREAIKILAKKAGMTAEDFA